MPRLALSVAALALVAAASLATARDAAPIRVLVITGDDVAVHRWKETAEAYREILAAPDRIAVDVTSAPGRDLTPENLARYDVLLLSYRDTPQGSPESRWSDANKAAFRAAVAGGKGLIVTHYASASFVQPPDPEFEKAIAGGWRTRGFHGPAHQFTVKTAGLHPISEGLPKQFDHPVDELYQNSLLPPGSVVLATAYSDPAKPRGTGKDEAVIWANTYGKGRVVNSVLGHDVGALADPVYRAWLPRMVEWAARPAS